MLENSHVKMIPVITMILLTGLLVSARECWMEPQKFYFSPGESAQVRFYTGENFTGQGWKATGDRVVRMEHHSARQVRDIGPQASGNTGEPLAIPLGVEGAHLIAMETNTALIKSDGRTFAEYLEKNALDEARSYRRKEGIAGDSAAEFYSRHTKLILQVGSTHDDVFKKVCHLPIEIVPEENPALLKKGDRMGFKILFQGKPLFGAKVKVWNRYNRVTSVQNIFSQQDGRIETHVSNPGVWMVSVVNMLPPKDPGAQYRSYRGTLVFGVR